MQYLHAQSLLSPPARRLYPPALVNGNAIVIAGIIGIANCVIVVLDAVPLSLVSVLRMA